jgi:hypothetical protein
LGSEAVGGDEYTALGILPGQGAIKRLQIGAATVLCQRLACK